MEQAQENCCTILLTDTPATEDTFGTHQPVADAIADLIVSEEEGISIALEGRWGSGKSTVVNLVKQRLEKASNDIAVVVFDAWAHQGDPLRRTFLETLIHEFFKPENPWISDKKRWQGVLDALGKKVREEEREQTPAIGFWGFLFALAALLTPLGLLIASMAEDDAHVGWLSLGVAMALLPFGVVVLMGLCVAFSYIRERRRGSKESTRKRLGEMGAIILQKTTTHIKTKAYERPDPTSVEFYNDFSDLMEEVLGKTSRKVVLVLDNLDRVAAEDALSILATMQTFLQDSARVNKEWFRRLWILIPYDPEGLSRLWDTEGGNREGATELGRRFVEKRFQVRFEVPPIVLSDWGHYLNRLLKQALPDHPKTKHELHLVYRVYDIARSEKGMPPTPRDVKLFVNQIGAFHRQWDDRFPLPHLAYYAVLFLNGESVVKDLREGKLPDPDVVRLLGGDVGETLAALAFNAEVEKAREFLLMADLTDALTKGKEGRFQEIADKHPDGVWLVLERVPFCDWAVSESANLAMSARVLQLVDFAKRAPEGVVRSVLDALSAALQAVERWEPLGEDIGEGIAAALRMKPDAELARRLLASVSASAPEEAEESTASDIDRWLDTQVPVLHAAWELGPDKVLGAGVLIPGNEAWCVQVCSKLAKDPDKKRYVPFLKSEVGGDEITGHLGQAISQGDLRAGDVRGFGALQELCPDMDWQEVAEAAFQRLNSAADYEPEEVIALLDALWVLSNSVPASKNRLLRLTNQGFVLHHLHHMRSKGSSEAIAWCVFTQLQMRPESTPPQNQIGNSMAGWNYLNSVLRKPSEHQELLRAFLGIVYRYKQYGLLLRLADQVPDWKPWVVASIEETLRSGRALKMLSPAEYIATHEFLKDELEEEIYADAVTTLVEGSDLLTRIRGDAFDPDRAELYLDVLRSGGAEDKDFNKWLSDGLKSVDAPTWTTALGDETYLVHLLVERYDKGGRYRLGLPFRDGVWRYAERVIHGEVEPQDPTITSGGFLKVLWKEDRAAMRRRLLDSAMDAEGGIAALFFDVFGDEIADVDMMRDDRDIVRRLFEPIVRKRNQRGLEWLADLLEKSPDLLIGYRPEYAVTDFRARVEEEGKQDTGAGIRAPLERIAGLLGRDRGASG